MIGIGAVVTLASWNDSEYASGTFTAGTFDLEGSTTGSSYGEHPTAGSAAGLSFTAPFSNLSPTDSTYGAFAIRLAANTTTNADVVLATPTTTGTVSNLTYGVVTTTSFGCDATAFGSGTSLVSDGTQFTAGSANLSLTKGSPVTSAGTPVYLCFKVTAGSGLAQGQSGTATWAFTATSNHS